MSKLALILAAASLMLAACSERPQTATPSHKRSDSIAWKGAPDDPFVAAGWTPGDETSWRNQIRQRNQLQNEYNRVQ